MSGDLEQSLAVPCSIFGCPLLETLLLDQNPLLATHDLNALGLPTVLFPNLASFQIGPSSVIDVRNGTLFLDRFFRLPTLSNLEISSIYFHADGVPLVIPPSLCNATNLVSLQLNAVFLRGAMPLADCWNRLTNLVSVDLSQNFISGGQEETIGLQTNHSLLCAHPSIRYVELSHNRF